MVHFATFSIFPEDLILVAKQMKKRLTPKLGNSFFPYSRKYVTTSDTEDLKSEKIK